MNVHPAVCGMCGGDDLMVIVRRIVGQIVIGVDDDGKVVGDGGPEEYDPREEVSTYTPVWCGECGAMTTPQRPA